MMTRKRKLVEEAEIGKKSTGNLVANVNTKKSPKLVKKKSVDKTEKVKGKEKEASRVKKKLQDTEKEGSAEPEQMENGPCDEEQD